MKIVTNERLIRRNSRIAQISMVAGLLVLAGGMYISFRQPEQFGLSMAALLVGFSLSQIGIYFSNRWGRRPRPDELLNQALKGLDNRHTIYHYIKPVSHLLVGPSGIWVLLPMHQRGTISYSKGRYRQRGGNLYLKIFAQEGLGRPDLEAAAERESAQKFLQNLLPEDEKMPAVQAALVFTNPKTNLEVDEHDEQPAAAVPVNKLKDLVRKTSKENSVPPRIVEQVQEALGE